MEGGRIILVLGGIWYLVPYAVLDLLGTFSSSILLLVRYCFCSPQHTRAHTQSDSTESSVSAGFPTLPFPLLSSRAACYYWNSTTREKLLCCPYKFPACCTFSSSALLFSTRPGHPLILQQFQIKRKKNLPDGQTAWLAGQTERNRPQKTKLHCLAPFSRALQVHRLLVLSNQSHHQITSPPRPCTLTYCWQPCLRLLCFALLCSLPSPSRGQAHIGVLQSFYIPPQPLPSPPPFSPTTLLTRAEQAPRSLPRTSRRRKRNIPSPLVALCLLIISKAHHTNNNLHPCTAARKRTFQNKIPRIAEDHKPRTAQPNSRSYQIVRIPYRSAPLFSACPEIGCFVSVICWL